MTFDEWKARQGFPVNSTQEPLWRECWQTAQVNSVYAKQLATQVEALKQIELKAQAGLCHFTPLASAREYLKDIRDEVADALSKERPPRM